MKFVLEFGDTMIQECGLLTVVPWSSCRQYRIAMPSASAKNVSRVMNISNTEMYTCGWALSLPILQSSVVLPLLVTRMAADAPVTI